MSTKTLPASVKAADDGQGIIEALVATYAQDSVGDRIVPGAFEKSLSEWGESGNQIPFIWSHQHNDIDAYLGDVVEAKETDDGLWVQAKLDMDDAHVRKVYRQIKGGRVKNYSFAYDILDEGPGEDGANELRQLKLYEVGPTLVGANELTQTLTVKVKPDDLAEKAGRTLSGKNEQKIRDAVSALQDVLSSLGEANDDDGKASGSGPAKDEAHEGKSEEPSQSPSATHRSAHMQLLALDPEGGGGSP